jgi:membrane protease YdiL (CAAX protease family)
MGALLLVLQLVAGRGPKTIAELPQPALAIALAAPLALAWFCLEAGLTEEFLFRAALQARAAAWLRSETAAIVAMAVLFGLAHAPGYVLRGAHTMEGFAEAPDPLTAAAYSIAVVSPVGRAFGVLWSRTRNLALVVLLHGWGDLVPNLAGFVRAWSS